MKSVQPNKSPRERREALLEKNRASSCTVESIVGNFEHPLTARELLTCLRDHKPCSISRSSLANALAIMDSACAHADVDVQADATHARLTPREVRLNEIGKAHIANAESEASDETV